jgi:hypothetical protein
VTRDGELGLAAVHAQIAASWRAAEAKCRRVREELAPADETRRQWEVMTEPARRLARAAGLELKRCGLIPASEPLTSAEPDGFTGPDQPALPGGQVWAQDTFDGSRHLPAPAGPDGPVSEAQRERAGLELLGLDFAHVQDELPAQVTQIAAFNRRRQEKIDERRSVRIPSHDPDERDLGPAWNVLAIRDRDAILQPPRPPIRPAAQILARAAPGIAQHAHDRDAMPEAEAG